MKIRRANVYLSNTSIVDEDFIKDFQESNFFDVPNALELIKDGETIWSSFSKFEIIKE